jgi:nanoRNase/pAp phosphatase (c-di-AMP/oligoRNAs hydrolase)
MASTQFRLVTRSDFDGLACAVLLKEIGMVDDILFVHPKDMQDGKIQITERDITTNLPYVASAHLAFDHHLSEMIRNTGSRKNHVIDPNAPSAARVVFDYFGGKSRFSNVSDEMMAAVDKADSAQYDLDDILAPKGWTLLNYLMDARTGLGRFKNFRISNYQLMMALIDCCRTMSIQQILELPDVKERSDLYMAHRTLASEQIERCTTIYSNVAVLDLRNEETIYATNRFLIYAMYPLCNLSIHQMWGLNKQNSVFAIGKSILDRSSKTNVGELCLRFGGGGHQAAGTCQVENSWAERALMELIESIHNDEKAALAPVRAASPVSSPMASER